MSDEAIHNERQKVYGDWRPNMAGTSLQIDGLRVQYEANNPGSPLPAWWAPLCLVATKLNRIASGNYHEDNFVDMRVYLGFVEQMQQGERVPVPPSIAPSGYEFTGEYRFPRRGEHYLLGQGAMEAVLNHGAYENDVPCHILRKIGGTS